METEERKIKKIDDNKYELYVYNKVTDTTVIKNFKKKELEGILVKLKSKSDDFTTKRMYAKRTTDIFDNMSKEELDEIIELNKKIQLANKYSSYNVAKKEIDGYTKELVAIKEQIDEIEELIK